MILKRLVAATAIVGMLGLSTIGLAVGAANAASAPQNVSASVQHAQPVG